MKKIGLLLSCLILLTAFTCDNEPLEGEFATDDGQSASSCEEAAINTGEAAINFVEATDDNYTQLCNAYIDALEDQIAFCGDDDGTIQSLIDSLGDCSNGGGGPGPVGGDYWPRAIGNSWDYDSAFFGEFTMEMTEIENIDGNDYYKMPNFITGSTGWVRKSGSMYYARQILGGFELPGYEVTTTPIEIIILDDTAEVGDTWTTDVTYTISYDGLPAIPDVVVDATYTFEMIARDITREVDGTLYENVLQVRLELDAFGETDLIDYYYSKDVGLIEYGEDQELTIMTSFSLN